MREAGLVVGRTLEKLKAAGTPGMSTADLDALAEDAIRGEGAIPSFKGYRGFPACICTSINSEIVHGIPSKKAVLREGDVVSIGCGAIVEATTATRPSPCRWARARPNCSSCCGAPRSRCGAAWPPPASAA